MRCRSLAGAQGAAGGTMDPALGLAVEPQHDCLWDHQWNPGQLATVDCWYSSSVVSGWNLL